MYTYWLDKAFRGMRLLSTFGHLYGGIIETRPKPVFRCHECNAEHSLVFDGASQKVSYGLGYELQLLDVGKCEWSWDIIIIRIQRLFIFLICVVPDIIVNIKLLNMITGIQIMLLNVKFVWKIYKKYEVKNENNNKNR